MPFRVLIYIVKHPFNYIKVDTKTPNFNLNTLCNSSDCRLSDDLFGLDFAVNWLWWCISSVAIHGSIFMSGRVASATWASALASAFTSASAFASAFTCAFALAALFLLALSFTLAFTDALARTLALALAFSFLSVFFMLFRAGS